MSEKKRENASDIKKKIVEAALSLAEEKGWEYVSLRDIAGKAGVEYADLRGEIDDKSDILVMIGRMIDRRVLENHQKPDQAGSVRERLFDLLMDRYDAMNDYRGGINAILESFKYDPKQIVISMPYICRSMVWMLDAAGAETYGVKGAAKVAGLSGIYLKVLRVWAEDESADLSKTMAALDKALGRAESWAETLGF